MEDLINYSTKSTRTNKLTEFERIQRTEEQKRFQRKEQIIKRLDLKELIAALPRTVPSKEQLEELMMEFALINKGISSEAWFEWALSNYSNFLKMIFNSYLGTFEECSAKIRGSKINRSKFIQETKRRSKVSEEDQKNIDRINNTIISFIAANRI